MPRRRRPSRAAAIALALPVSLCVPAAFAAVDPDGVVGPESPAWAGGLPLFGGLGALFARRRARRAAPPRSVSATERTVLLDPVDAETHEAMDRISAAVRAHDLGAPAGLGDAADAARRGDDRREAPRGDDAFAMAGAAPRHGAGDTPNGAVRGTGDAPSGLGPPARLMTSAELERAPRAELREQVRIVSAHNTKLHKVVIAQQASLESARDSIAHHRSVARRAKEETRAALEHKRVAVKLARRERAERMRVTDEHERSQAALSNAMALLRATGAVREQDLGGTDDAGDVPSEGGSRRVRDRTRERG